MIKIKPLMENYFNQYSVIIILMKREHHMKKLILFGSILSIFILLTIPHISAVEYQTRNEVIKNELEEKLAHFNDDIDLIDELLKSILLSIYYAQIRFFELRISMIENNSFSENPVLRDLLLLSTAASAWAIWFAASIVPYKAEEFFQATEELPDIIEFIVTLISIPYFVILDLLNITFWFILCFWLVYIVSQLDLPYN